MNVNCDIVVDQLAGDSGGKFKDNTK